MKNCLTRIPILALSVWIASVAGAQAGPEWARWPSIPARIQSGEHEQALREILSDPAPDDPVFHYNVGTLYFILKQYGKAVAHLEKANHLSPHDADIQANLRTAREEYSRIVREDRSDPASNGVEKVFDRVPAEEMRALVGILILLGCILLLFRYSRTRSLHRSVRSPAGSVAVSLLVLAGLIYGGKRYGDADPPAFCLESQTVRSGPGKAFLEVGRIEVGTKVRLTGMTAPEEDAAAPGAWNQVRIGAGRLGWLPAVTLLPL